MKQSERPSYRRWYKKNRKRLIKRADERRRANPEKIRAYHRQWYRKNIDRLRPLNREKCRRAYQANRKHFAELAREGRRRLREEFIAAYGSECACCGETEKAFLTLEHTKRDGKKHRARVGPSSQILADLKRRGWPKDDYEILCFNCNRASWELGTCPHRTNRK